MREQSGHGGPAQMRMTAFCSGSVVDLLGYFVHVVSSGCQIDAVLIDPTRQVAQGVALGLFGHDVQRQFGTSDAVEYAE